MIRLAMVALAICLGAGTAWAAEGDSAALAAGLANVGISTKADLATKRPTVTVTVDQQKFLTSIPTLKAMGMLNPDLNQTFINMHEDSLTDVFGVEAVTMVIMDTYKNNPTANYIRFTVNEGKTDDYGNSVTKEMFSFDFTRALYKRVNWENFNAANLMKIAPHFRLSPWMNARMAAETSGE